jgi:hypothetical protein
MSGWSKSTINHDKGAHGIARLRSGLAMLGEIPFDWRLAAGIMNAAGFWAHRAAQHAARIGGRLNPKAVALCGASTEVDRMTKRKNRTLGNDRG